MGEFDRMMRDQHRLRPSILTTSPEVISKVFQSMAERATQPDFRRQFSMAAGILADPARAQKLRDYYDARIKELAGTHAAERPAYVSRKRR
jgi:hypothetical protein